MLATSSSYKQTLAPEAIAKLLRQCSQYSCEVGEGTNKRRKVQEIRFLSKLCAHHFVGMSDTSRVGGRIFGATGGRRRGATGRRSSPGVNSVGEVD